MLHGATGLGEHDITKCGIVGRRSAVGDGEIAARVVAVKEDVDVVDLAGSVFVVGRQRKLAVGGDIQCNLDIIYTSHGLLAADPQAICQRLAGY